jgi:hypothetical protein
MDGGPAQLQVALDVLDSFSLDFSRPSAFELSETIYRPASGAHRAAAKNRAPALIERLGTRRTASPSATTALHNRNALYSCGSIPAWANKRNRALFDTFLTIEAIISRLS